MTMPPANDASMLDEAAVPTKVAMRQTLRALRGRITASKRELFSEKAALRLATWETIERARRIALFVSLGDEIDTRPLWELLRNRGIDVVMPRVDRKTTSLSFVLTEDEAELVDGPFGLKEPSGAPVELSSIDVVVMPGLGFDRFGGRLGYGVGYYDRALADYSGLCVGFCYGCQLLVDPLPQAPHDVRVTAVAHENELVMCEPGV